MLSVHFSLEDFAAFSKHHSDLVAVVSQAGDILHLNAAGRRLAGLAEDADGCPRLSDMISGTTWEMLRDTAFPRSAANGSWTGDGRWRRLDTGHPVEVRLVVSDAGRTANGDRLHLLRAEPAAAGPMPTVHGLSEDELKQVINYVGDPIFVKDRHHRWVLLNDAYCEFTGYRRETLIGKSDFDFYREEEAREFWDKDERVLATGEENINEEPFTDAAGVPHTIWTRKTRYINRYGEKYVVGIIRDITQRKRLEEGLRQVQAELELRVQQLAETNRMLVEAERVKSDFLARVSHELRTPLTLILAPLESLQEAAPLSSTHRSLLQTMHNNAVRLMQMVTALLDMARLEAGRSEVAREPTRIVALTRSTVADFQPMMQSRGLAFRFTFDREEAAVDMDRYLYDRILFNLLSNAIKWTPPGGQVAVDLQVRDDRLRLSVSDTGTGIDAEDLPHVFDKFWQARGPTRRFEGSGLGLALVREFARLLGGNATAESEPGRGTILMVECYAPAAEAPVGDQRLDRVRISGPPPLPDEGEADPGAGHGRVLIAEDNTELASYITTLLRDMCQTRIAMDGEEALAVVAEWHPDLVLSDVMMPRRDGLSLCRELKSNPAYASTKVVLLTALTLRDALIHGWEAGADDYLFKPFHPGELVARIKSLLPKRRARIVETPLARIDLSAQPAEALHDLVTFQESERRLLSAELHDVISQPLAALFYRIQLCQNLIQDDPQRALEEMEASRQMSQSLLLELGQLIWNLWTPDLQGLDIGAALRLHVQAFTQETGMKVKLQLPKRLDRVQGLVALFLYRIVQEALTNVRRHAQATKVDVVLAASAQDVSGKVRDNGKGADLAKVDLEKPRHRHFGLRGMKCRAEMLGGGLELRSEPGRGSELAFRLPYQQPQREAFRVIKLDETAGPPRTRHASRITDRRPD